MGRLDLTQSTVGWVSWRRREALKQATKLKPEEGCPKKGVWATSTQFLEPQTKRKSDLRKGWAATALPSQRVAGGALAMSMASF